MAKIKYTSASPKAGTIEHINNATAATLVAAGFAEILPIAPRGTAEWLEDMKLMHSGVPVATPKVQWGVHITSAAQRPVIVANCSNNCTKDFRYEGPVELKDKKGKVVSRPAENVVFTHSCGAHAPVKVPAQVVQQYVDLVSKTPVVYTTDEANMLAFAASKGDSGVPRDVVHGKAIPGQKLAYEA